jgi:hypothetical protein
VSPPGFRGVPPGLWLEFVARSPAT